MFSLNPAFHGKEVKPKKVRSAVKCGHVIHECKMSSGPYVKEEANDLSLIWGHDNKEQMLYKLNGNIIVIASKYLDKSKGDLEDSWI